LYTKVNSIQAVAWVEAKIWAMEREQGYSRHLSMMRSSQLRVARRTGDVVENLWDCIY